MTAIHLIIHGRVQGVGYRAWAGSTARKLGLKGWVRNRRDGTVEAVFCGDAPAVTLMRQECEHGPRSAKVTRIDESQWNDEIFSSFEQLSTL